MQSNYKSERALGYQQITSLVAATALTIPTGASFCMITPETQAVRWRDDGTDPTAAVGYPLAVGAELRFTAGQLTSLKFIEQAASAKINVCYYAGA
jgi:hypothetical protein